MKKLAILMVLLLVPAMAFAQSNTAIVEQVGIDQVSNITQTGNSNYVDTDQSVANNNATVIQDGDNNVIGTPSEEDAIGIQQIGNSNTADITQTGDDNIVSEYRLEKSVFASVKQNGDDNSMTIEQTGDDNVVGQGSFPYHSIGQDGSNNTANISQEGGNSNKVGRFYQYGNLNGADIDQVGNENYVIAVSQLKLGGNDTYNDLDIDQVGDDNRATAAQEGLNIIGVIQQGSVSAASYDNKADQSLSLTDAEGHIIQAGVGGNDALQQVWRSGMGDNNYLKADQDGDGNKSKQFVYARVNSSSPYVYSADNNRGLSDDELATTGVFQTGDTNETYQYQTGSENDVYASQSNDLNDGTMTQIGDDNAITLMQDGGDTATIMQTGNSNSVITNQY